MNTKDSKIYSSLFWRLSFVFVALLLVFAAISIYIFSKNTSSYNAELNQQLNKDLASHTVKEISPYIVDGKVNQEGMHDLMHSMMVINPNVEVYILDNDGNIKSYMAPEKVVKLEKVELTPILSFLGDGETKGIIEGDDPRNPGECKIFSAAPIIDESGQTGYVYIVLASQKYVSATEQVLGSYILGLSIKTILIVLLVSLTIGLLAFRYITRHLDRITSTMSRFRDGDLDARITSNGGQEFKIIADTYNGMAESLQENIEGLEGVDKLRKELISNISHDLRTPIASIQGYAETLEMKLGDLDEETQRSYLATIVKNSDHLSRLVERLFELSKLESGQVDIRPSTFSLAELVHDVAAKFRILSQKKGVSINTILEKGGTQVEADISLIDRVLQNLIDNAIKFCSEGDYINIELDVTDPESVKVRIADSGAGISKEDLDHIFDRYFKENSANNAAGTGLGLSIAQRIVQLHGGSISVNSQLHHGTTFSFSLPKAV